METQTGCRAVRVRHSLSHCAYKAVYLGFSITTTDLNVPGSSLPNCAINYSKNKPTYITKQYRTIKKPGQRLMQVKTTTQSRPCAMSNAHVAHVLNDTSHLEGPVTLLCIQFTAPGHWWKHGKGMSTPGTGRNWYNLRPLPQSPRLLFSHGFLFQVETILPLVSAS